MVQLLLIHCLLFIFPYGEKQNVMIYLGNVYIRKFAFGNILDLKDSDYATIQEIYKPRLV